VIPLGRWHRVDITGYLDKSATCEACNHDFTYRVAEVGTGDSNSFFTWSQVDEAAKTEDLAVRNLIRRLQAAEYATPCPHCGWYQRSMVRLLKKEGMIRIYRIGFGLSFVLSIAWFLSVIFFDSASQVLAYLPLSTIFGTFVSGITYFFCYSPNPPHRKI
jgi:hypothetical protein